MLDDLKIYLQEQGISNIYIDFMPAAEKTVNAVSLHEWDNVISKDDSSGEHYIQIQVRRIGYDAAKRDCKKILELLDSGSDERLIWLNEEKCCIGRPRRGALLLERREGLTTFYCETAIWTNMD